MRERKEIQLKPEEIEQFRRYRQSHLFHRAFKVPPSAIGLTNNVLAIIKQEAITYWEQLTCAGYNPALRQLEATVLVKRTSGYSGDPCSGGSPEYVRFFIDWGAGLVDVGLNSVQVFDIPDTPKTPNHPLSFLIVLTLDEKSHRRICDEPVVPKLRAVLSWNEQPGTDPDVLPHFGNVIDTNIQIQPALKLKDLARSDLVKRFAPDIDLEQEVPLKLHQSASQFHELLQADKRAGVPQHRTLFGAFHQMITPNPTAFSPHYSIPEPEKLKLDWAAAIVALNNDKANVDFEEVRCAGLDPMLGTLGAVIRVKKSSGYSGDLCSTGSYEYVSFWADFDNDGSFGSYLGTVNVKVHDISPFPDGGVDYSVMLPVDFSKHQRSCKTPQVIGIRAVLSWATPPSATDANELKTWGNRLDVKVLLRRLEQPGPGGLIEQFYDVGGVPIVNIGTVSFLAYPSPASGPGSNRPWGGVVRIGGRIQGGGAPPSVWFKVECARHGQGNWQPVTTQQTFEMMYPQDYLHPQHNVTVSAVNGWLAYQENLGVFPAIFERTALLSTWNTNALADGAYDLRVAYTTDNPSLGAPASVRYSTIVTVNLCNTGFTVSPTPNTAVDLSATLDMIIVGGDCHKYQKRTNDTIDGRLRVVHPYFGGWRLDLQPSVHANGVQALPPSRSFVSPPDTGNDDLQWTLSVGGLDTCGYTLTLWAEDRTIVNSNGAIVHRASKAVGFSVV